MRTVCWAELQQNSSRCSPPVKADRIAPTARSRDPAAERDGKQYGSLPRQSKAIHGYSSADTGAAAALHPEDCGKGSKMVQTRTTDCGDPLRRHWLHGKRTNGRTGTAQRYPESVLNYSQLYANGKPGWCLKHQPGIPPPPLLPLSGGSKRMPVFLYLGNEVQPLTLRTNAALSGALK